MMCVITENVKIKRVLLALLSVIKAIPIMLIGKYATVQVLN